MQPHPNHAVWFGRKLFWLLPLACLAGWAAMQRPTDSGANSDRPEVRSWPDFHGVARDNISPEKGLLRQWPENGPPLVWKASGCGDGCSGVTIAEGKIYTAGDFDE